MFSDENPSRRQSDLIAAAWLVICAIWLVALFVTDIPAWTLAIWIATTIGPVTWLRRR